MKIIITSTVSIILFLCISCEKKQSTDESNTLSVSNQNHSTENIHNVVLYIKSNDTLLWNEERIEIEDISEKVSKLKSIVPNSLHQKINVSIKASSDVKMRVLVDVKLALKKSNIKSMKFSTVRKKQNM